MSGASTMAIRAPRLAPSRRMYRATCRTSPKSVWAAAVRRVDRRPSVTQPYGPRPRSTATAVKGRRAAGPPDGAGPPPPGGRPPPARHRASRDRAVADRRREGEGEGQVEGRFARAQPAGETDVHVVAAGAAAGG